MPWPSCIAVGSDIHFMCPPTGSAPAPHSSSQPCMRPICDVWVASMSAASCLRAGSVVWSRSQEAISTACWWCTVMSWANPTSTESAAGTAEPVEPGSPSSRPPAAPSSSRPSARPAATKIRTQRGRAAPVRAGPSPAAGAETAGSRPGSAGITARQA